MSTASASAAPRRSSDHRQRPCTLHALVKGICSDAARVATFTRALPTSAGGVVGTLLGTIR
jgi:hypothetical protein